MCLSKGTVCRRRLLLFLLAGLLLCLLRFLSHVALRDPKVGSMQVDLDMHKYRVHHNCKIDTARFEEGKRRRAPRPERTACLWQFCLGGAGVAPRSSELSSLFWRPQLAHQDIWLNPEDGRLLHISGLLPFGLEGLLFHLR